MTTSPLRTSVPAPERSRDLAAARTHYEELFGWPVAVQVSDQHLTVALGQVVDAITMPAGLAGRVHTQLGIAMLAGPVIAHLDGGRWTFLTQPASTMWGDIVDGLAEYDVRHAAPGTHIVLPTEFTEWRWLAEPRPNQMLPSAYAVVATARRVCAALPAA